MEEHLAHEREGIGLKLTLRLGYPPSANTCWRNVAGRTLVSKEYRAYKEKAKWLCWQQLGRLAPLEGELVVHLVLYRPRRVGDIDNRIKPVFDSLNGVAWVDDSQICHLEVDRFDDKLDPRVEVEVESAFKPHA